MNTEKLKELREKHPSVALELDLISGRVSPETGLENPDYKPDEMQDLMEFYVLEVMDVISEQGHSGFSHGYLVSLLIPLLRGLPITPLTGNDWEWVKGLGGGDYYQNKRCFSVFKDGANAVAYNTNGYAFSDNGGESYYTCAASHKNITFPCTSKELETEYIVKEAMK